MRKIQAGFTLVELCMVIAGGVILLAIAVPVLDTVMNGYHLTLAAQSIVTHIQFARMKSVSSNESFRVDFPGGQRFYQIEASDGSVVAGPFWLPGDVAFNNTDPGAEVTFGARFVSFSPTGDVPAAGPGSAGRVKVISRSGGRIDIVVGTGGIIRQTPVYKAPPAPF